MKVKILLMSMLIPMMLSAASSTERQTLDVNGQQREMLVHLPNKLSDDAPLVISCHGMNQDANYQCSTNSKWTAVSDTAGFVVVFPDGINRGWDLGGSKDVDFMCAIIDDMHARYNTSVTRVYLSGFSMGGMFTYFCANAIPDRIAAFVPVSGYPMGDKSVTASRPVPLMHVHGTGDDVCRFNGVQPTLDNWVKHNKCNPTPEVIKPYPAGKASSVATMTKWTGGTDGAVVHLLEFEGKGHWQSEDPVSCLTSVEAWNFMKQWSLGPEPPVVKTIVPEANSFDLATDGLDITITFDAFVQTDGVEATLANGGKVIPLTVKADGKTLTLTVPAIEAGEYELSVKNVPGSGGGVLEQYNTTYAFGCAGSSGHVRDTFLRTLEYAKAVYAGIPADMQKKPAAILLLKAIEKYDGLVSTAPSVYEAAITYLQSKIDKAMAISGIESVAADGGEVVAVEYFDIMGRPIAEPKSGLAICSLRYSDGSIKVKKIKY